MARTISQTINLQARPESVSKYITKIDEAGIKVHPQDFNEDVLIKNNYIQVDGTGLEIYSQGVSRAKYGAVSRIGKAYVSGANDNESHLELDYHSLQMIDREGHPYFEVKDLRNSNGTVTLTVDYIGDGTTTAYSISPPADNTNYTVTVDNNSGSGITKYTYGVAFSAAPSAGATITITYTTSSILSKAYTFGLRNSNSKQGALSISEGYLTEASGSTSHAEGNETKAKGHHSHAEGDSTIASGLNCHAEGSNTQANGLDSHAEGCYTIARGGYSHAEGYHTIAGGWGSHAQNYYAVATEAYQTVIGKYNTATRSGTSGNYTYTDVGSYAFIIGNGTGDATANRSNALTIDWNGNLWIAGALTQNSDCRLKNHKSYLGKEAIDFIQQLKPVHYEKDNILYTGFYAQDIEPVDPWHCFVGKDENGYKTLNYINLIAPLTTYCQYLEKEIEELKKEIQGLKK